MILHDTPDRNEPAEEGGSVMLRVSLGVFVTASALALAAPSIAAAESPQKQVDLSGIDLSTDRGAERALRRLENAAEEMCGVRTGLQPVSERRAAQACVSETMADAVDNLNVPRVTARFEQTRAYAAVGRSG